MKRLICLILCLILLTGCAADTDKPYVPTGNGLSSDEPRPPEGSGITEQTVSLAYYPDRSLSPFQSGELNNRALFSLIYQGLFAVDDSYHAVPILCSRYIVSRDMKTYTFYLEEATFSDGKTLTAADVVASLKKAADSSYYGGRFGYVEEFSETDDGAVMVTLTTPYENFQLLLDVPILRKDQLDRERPLGTGPYVYEEFEGSLRLRRRTDWWCVAKLPVTAQIIELVAGENTAQLRDEFEFSGLGLVCTDPGSEGYVDFHSDYELWDYETGVFLYLGCNERSKLLSKGNIRQMLTYAINRDRLVEDHYRGFAYSTWLPASPRSPWYSAVLTRNLTYNPDKLAQAVAEAGELTGSLVLLVNRDDNIRLRAARDIAAMLENCGLTVTMSELATGDYVAALENGKFDLYLGQTKLSANMDLSAFFAPKGTLSFGKMDDAVIYALCKESLANSGNYYTLYKEILKDGMLCPVLFRSCAIFAQRGTFVDLYASRDNVFYYHLGKDPDAIRTVAE